MTDRPIVPPVDVARAKPVGVGGRIRTWFLTGLIVAGPLAVTAWLVWWFVDLVDRSVRPLLPERFWPDSYVPVRVPGTGVVLAFVAITLLGFLTANFAGRQLIRLGETILNRMPIVRTIYKSVKQIFETVLSQQGTSFRKAGLVEFPVKGWWSVVFYSAAPSDDMVAMLPGGDAFVSVFLPCAPNPTTGFYFYLPAHEVLELPMPPDEVFKLIMSAGLIQPVGQPTLVQMAEAARRHRAAAGALALERVDASPVP